MTSELKSATSRANGAKSRGPKTAEGREKSSRNSLSHGFTSKKTMVLHCESEEEFQLMLGRYAATYQPGSPVEEGLVNEMVAARWRMQRLRLIETALLDSEMQREELPESETTDDPAFQLAFAFRRLVDESHAISLASRYESRLHRIHERSHRTLRELQKSRPNSPSVSEGAPAPASVQPEPPPPTGDRPVLVPDRSVEDAPPSSTTVASVIPPTPKPQLQPSPCVRKLRNEPTPPSSAAVKKDRQRLSTVGHRGFRRIDIKRFRWFGLFKVA
jgi:hypothetical protein